MRRVLLVSELFYPTNRIGALRPSKICKFLIEKGYDVDVITAHPSEGIYNTEHCRVYAVKGECPDSAVAAKSSRSVNLTGAFWDQLRYFKRTLNSYRAGKKYAKMAVSLFENGTLRAADYDACFTTFGPISSVLIGLELKRKYHIPNWICDFRDPIAVKMSSVFMWPFYKHLQNKACQYADKVVAVSNGYVDRICGNKYREKAHMIPNGYDISDADTRPKKNVNDKLTLTYVGALYEGKRDISPVFRALSELNADGKIDIAKIKFLYAGSNYSTLVSQAERYNMGQILENCGLLSRGDCLQMQYNSDVLILSTWNERGEKGVFPGKFLEYMLVGRPIIALTCGEVPNSEVTLVMREGQLGMAYESACDNVDYGNLKRYVEKCYSEWVQSAVVTYHPVQSVVDRYNYSTIMERLEELICGK